MKILLSILFTVLCNNAVNAQVYVDHNPPIAKDLHKTCQKALDLVNGKDTDTEYSNLDQEMLTQSMCFSYLEGYKDAFQSPIKIWDESYCIDFRKGSELQPNGYNGYAIASAFVKYFETRQDELTAPLEIALPKALSNKLKCK